MRRHTGLAFAATLFVLAYPSSAQTTADGTVSPTHQAAIRELFDLTNVAEMGLQEQRAAMEEMKPRLMSDLRGLDPHVARELVSELSRAMDEVNYEAIYLPIYARVFSEPEIRDLIAFYQSPVGSRLVELTPEIMREGQAIGSELGRRIGAAVAARVLRRSMKTDGLSGASDAPPPLPAPGRGVFK